MTTQTTLGRLQRVELRNCWEREDTDFTPWLASNENIALLSDALGIELEVQAEEAAVGPFRADILCRNTTNDELVIIENQLERTDHSHLGQILTYAAGLEAKTIVWIAQHFTEEHRAALDWLNHFSDEAIQFFGIEIEVWRIGESVPAPKFNLVATPNDWSKTAKKAANQRGPLSAHQQVQFKYWEGFGGHLETAGSTFKKPKPSSRSWMNWGLGRAGTALTATINTKKFVIKVEFNNHNHPTWFHKFHAQRAELENELGFELEWRERPDKKLCEMRVYMLGDMREEEQHQKGYRWMLKHMEIMGRVFRPYIAALDDTPLDDAGPEE